LLADLPANPALEFLAMQGEGLDDYDFWIEKRQKSGFSPALLYQEALEEGLFYRLSSN
jgi:hypothetical protein